jgi:hypothetical protein
MYRSEYFLGVTYVMTNPYLNLYAYRAYRFKYTYISHTYAAYIFRIRMRHIYFDVCGIYISHTYAAYIFRIRMRHIYFANPYARIRGHIDSRKSICDTFFLKKRSTSWSKLFFKKGIDLVVDIFSKKKVSTSWSIFFLKKKCRPRGRYFF